MEWTIGELAEQASAALAPTARPNGRVRDVPNERVIRWYSTIGLLDPPSARRGRVAVYGRRHLLQLIAVKRRQADGRSIAEIQVELAGATDRTLEAIARLPEAPPEHRPERAPGRGTGRGPVPDQGPAPERGPAPDDGSNHEPDRGSARRGHAAGAPSPATARPRFWTGAPASAPSRPAPAPAARPVPPAPPTASGAPEMPTVPPVPPVPPAPYARPALPAVPAAVAVHGVRLADGVTLLLDGGQGGGRAPSPDELAEIAAASRELLSLLRERGLTPPEGPHP
ncbi:MerR family transcriptional regulator [Streptosporangium sp. NPDC050855]|uniref:MerR family transcriptional regulator n=1 Tax=Streptosporangium sp. NPDC050855 TaxID=3366194 RepID=UPI00379D889D